MYYHCNLILNFNFQIPNIIYLKYNQNFMYHKLIYPYKKNLE